MVNEKSKSTKQVGRLAPENKARKSIRASTAASPNQQSLPVVPALKKGAFAKESNPMQSGMGQQRMVVTQRDKFNVTFAPGQGEPQMIPKKRRSVLKKLREPALKALDSIGTDPNLVKKRLGPINVPRAAAEIEAIERPKKIKLNPFLFLNEEQIEAKKKLLEERKKKVYTLKELKTINKVEKQDYINKILDEDVQITQYLKRVQGRIEDTNDQLIEQ